MKVIDLSKDVTVDIAGDSYICFNIKNKYYDDFNGWVSADYEGDEARAMLIQLYYALKEALKK